MRYLSAYYLLLLYTLAVCKPIIPYVQDHLAHAFSETHHIATVHAVKGKNHAHLNVGEAEKENNSNASNTKSYDPVSIHDHVEVNTTEEACTLESQVYNFYQERLTPIPANNSYRPPRI